MGTQPLGAGTQPSPLGVKFFSNRVRDTPIFGEILSCGAVEGYPAVRDAGGTV